MADPYGYDRPTVVDLNDNVNTFRRKVNQISDDLGDKRRLLNWPGTSLATDSDIVGNLIELDYRLNQTSADLYLRADGGSLYIQNGTTSTIAAEFLYDSAAGNLSLITPMSGDFTIDTVGDIILDADGNDIRFKNGDGNDEVIHTLANTGVYTITAPDNYIIDVQGTGDITLDAAGQNIYFDDAGNRRITYTLGATTDTYLAGNYTLNVDGSIADSAGTTYSLVAGTNITQTSSTGSTTHISGTTTTHTVGTDYALTAGGNYTVDVDGSITDSANSISRISTTTTTDTVGTNYTLTAGGNYTVDVDGAIKDSAGTSITHVSGTTTTHTVGTNYALTAGGNYTVDVDGSLADSADTISRTSGTTTTDTVGTNYNLTAGGNSVVNITGSIDEDAGTTISRTAGTNIADVASAGSYTLDAGTFIKDSAGTTHTIVAGTDIVQTASTGSYALNTGTTLEQTAGSSITQTSTTTFDQVSGGNFTTTVTGDVLVDASGDITLDADGNDIFFRDGNALRLQFNLGNNNNENWTGNLTRNVSGSIIDSAETSITNVSGTTTTHTVGTDYALTAGGNYTVDVDGSIADSAGTTISRTAGTNITDTATTGSITQTSGTTFNQVSGGNFTTTVTGDVLVDASGDITLDAAGQQINFVDATNTRMVFNLDATPQIDVTGNYTVSGSGSILQSSTTTQELTGTDITLDASNNIYLEADGDQIHLRAITANKFIFGVGASPTLDITGNYTETGSGFLYTKAGTYLKDSAATTSTLTANNAITRTSVTSTITDVAQTNISQTANTGSYTLDAGTSIKDSAGTSITHVSGTTTTHTVGTNYTLNVGGTSSISSVGDYTLDVEGDIIFDAADSDVFFKRAGTTFGQFQMGAQGNVNTLEMDVPQGDLYFDVTGDIVLDADGNDIIFKNGSGDDTVTHTLADDANYTITAPNNYTVDVGGDIVLDADGGDIILSDAGTEDYRFATDGTFSRTGNLTIDASGDITLDAAGDNIVFADAGNTRITYTLGATTDIAMAGSLTTNVGGSIFDSAGTSITQVAGTDYVLYSSNDLTDSAGGTIIRTSNDAIFDRVIAGSYTLTSFGDVARYAGNAIVDSAVSVSRTGFSSISDTTSGTFTQTSGTTFTQTSGGNFTTNVTGEYLVDASGDITLDADGGDIFFKDGGTTDYQFATNGTISRTGDLILDISGDITLSADGNDIIFHNGNGGDTVTHTLSDAGVYTITQSGSGDYTVDVGGDIILDADGGNVTIKDNNVTQFDFIAGTNKEIDVPSGDLTLDVAGDITLDADGNDIIFKNGDGADTVTHTLADTGLYTMVTPGTYVVDAGSDITLDADGNDIIFKNGAGGDTVTHTLADDANYTITAPANYTIDVVGDIFFDADGGNVQIKDAGTTQFEFLAGTNKEIDVPSGDLTIDVAGDIILNADGGDIRLYDDTVQFGAFTNSPTNLVISSTVNNSDIVFKGYDNSVLTTALTLDMSDSGSAIFNHDIYLPDNGRAVFGAGSDLQIYHDGLNSYIDDTGTGNLLIRGDAEVIIGNAAKKGIKVVADGEVELRHNDAIKFATTATGIDVTGTTVTDGMTSDGNVFVSTSSSTTDGTDGAFVDIKNTDTTTSVVSGVRFLNGTTTAFKGAVFFEDLAGDGRGDIVIASNNVASGATTVGLADQRLRVSRSGDISFYDSVAAVQNFYWDASTSRLGLGTTSPLSPLHIEDSDDVVARIKSTGANSLSRLILQNDARTWAIDNDGANSDALTFYDATAAVERARIDANGNLLVGRTSTSGVDTNGHVRFASGESYQSATSNTVQFINRNGTDGELLSFYKTGVLNGTIGIEGGNLYIDGSAATGKTGIEFSGSEWFPRDEGVNTDGVVSLGDASNRFKDLYYTGRISSGGVSATGSKGIWVDSATGNVGVGVASPDGTLHVKDTIAQVYIQSNDGQPAQLVFGDVSDASRGRINYDASDNIIFENNNLIERMRINSGGNVGIGTSSPNGLLETNSTGDNFTYLRSGDANTVGIIFGNQSDAATASIQMLHSDNSLSIRGYNNTERARIDANGNLLVANTTTSTPGINNATTGHSLNSNGFAAHSRDGNVAALFVNVNGAPSSKGVLTSFRKQGVYIGEIGYDDSDLTIYSTTANHIGLRFGNGAVLPVNNVGTVTASIADLGGSTYKFKDLWISGTANLPLVDIDGGNIDGATLGANSAIVAGTFTDLTVTDTLNLPTTISPTSIVFNDAVQEVNAGFKGGVRYSNSMTFGNDSDLAIYHDGSHSYIKDKGDGDLRLTTNAFGVRNSTDTQNMITAAEGGAVTLYHNDSARLATTSTGVTVSGLLTADTKSFTIDHPTKEGMKLRYGSLEGPEHGVYVRGRLNGENTIELPEVWLGLVDEDTITVNLTPIGKGECWVENIQNNTVTVGGHLNCFYMVLAERKDVEKLEVEFPADGS